MATSFLTRSDFEHAIQQFKDQASLYDHPWTFLKAPIVNHGYLQRTTQITSQSTRSEPSLLQDDTTEESDPATLTIRPPLIITLQHHILYSPTYKVPVLYFDAYFTDGARLTFDELYTHVIPTVYQTDLRHPGLVMQGAITQTDHPLLNRPYWYTHPCETRSLLDTMGINTIQAWLSWVGPLVRCHVPPELFID